MVNLTIDGKAYTAEPGQTIIQLIYEHGLDLPHFCWHPSLSVAGNCRMCLVEIEKMPKLAIACSTTVAEGMVVHTQSANALKGREDVMEFLLINHPLDCPICDEAGQCKLQDYAFNHSRGISRFEEEKNHKDKRVEFGPHVLFDGERCISCSRCIRFSQEIADQPVLSFVQRGDHVTIEVTPGEQLDNPYAMNVIDICPVGALTSQDFRFKARAWDMSFTDSVCPSCSRGCNIRVGVRNNEILRLEPRPNPNVNDFWMCDEGRLNSPLEVNSDDRVSGAYIKVSGEYEQAPIENAVEAVTAALRRHKAHEIAFVASGKACLEDNYLFAQLAKHLGVGMIGYIADISGSDDFLLRRADKNPNSAGLHLLGIEEFGEKFTAALESKRIKMIYALEDDFIARNQHLAPYIDQVDTVVVHSVTMTDTVRMADIILPSSAWAEREGVFVNFEGWANKLNPAVVTAHIVRGMEFFTMSRLDRYGTPFDRWAQSRKVDARESWQFVQMIGKHFGMKSHFITTEDVFDAAASNVSALTGMSYESLGKIGAPVKGSHKTPRSVTYKEVYQLVTSE